jgi:hypothetical protein
VISPFPLEQQLAATWRAARTDPLAGQELRPALDRVPRRHRRRRLVRRPLA